MAALLTFGEITQVEIANSLFPLPHTDWHLVYLISTPLALCVSFPSLIVSHRGPVGVLEHWQP